MPAAAKETAPLRRFLASHETTGIVDPDELLRRAVEVAADLAGAGAITLAVSLDEQEGALLEACPCPAPCRWEGAAKELPGMPELEADRAWDGDAAELALMCRQLRDGPARGWPLAGSTRLLGAFYVAGTLDDESRLTLRLLASRLAVTFERALLQEELRQRSLQFRQVLLTTADIARQLEFTEVAQRIVEGVTKTTDFRLATLTLREGDACVRVAAAGIDPLRLGLTTEHSRWVELTKPEYRLSEHSYLVPPDAPADWSDVPDMETRSVPGAWTPDHGLIVALEGAGRVIGYLSVDEPRSGRVPTKQMVEVLELFARQVQAAFANSRLYDELRAAARRDGLTGLQNRTAFWEGLNALLRDPDAHPISVAVVDLDRFKRINDDYGHVVGDAALCHVTDRLERSVRQTDHVYRVGGEEFTIVLPCTGAEEALQVLQRVRLAVQQARANIPAVTVSAGIAAFPQHASQADELFRSADAAMYRAKRSGGDSVVIASGD